MIVTLFDSNRNGEEVAGVLAVVDLKGLGLGAVAVAMKTLMGWAMAGRSSQ